MRRIRNFLPVIVASIILLSWPKEGYMSRIYPEEISLEQLIARSSLILVVDRSPGSAAEGEKARYPFKVIEELRNNSQTPLTGKEILVSEAYHARNAYLEKTFYSKGQSKSPVLKRYKTKADLSKDKRFIVFLVSGEEGSDLEFSVEGAYESVSEKKKVLELITRQ